MSSKRIAVIGGGISGLSAAYFLKKRGHHVEVFEASPRAGGYAGSHVEDGWVVERGPSSLLDSEPTLQELIDDLGLRSAVLYPNPLSKNRWVFFQNALLKIPMSPPALLKTPLLSFKGKCRLLTEGFRHFQAPEHHESVYEFASRHFGEEVAFALALPMVTGIFSGDARELDLEACFPKVRKMEREHGSLIRSQFKKPKTASRPKLFTFQNGIQDLVDGLARALKANLHLKSEVREVRPHNSRWQVVTEVESRDFDLVILGVAWPTVNELLGSEVPLEIEPRDWAPVASVSFGLGGPSPIDGFGLLVHPDHRMGTLGILSPSSIFSGRAPAGDSLLTFVMGGRVRPEIVSWADADLERLALQEAHTILGQTLNPKRRWIHRYPFGITQYTVKNIERLKRQKELVEARPGLILNTHAFGGVSVADIVAKSFHLAQSL